MDAAIVMSRFADREYGQNIFVDPPIFDEKAKLYYSNIRSKIPVFIYDDRSSADYKIRVLKIDSLGSIYINDKLELMPQLTTYRDKCYENLDNLLALWHQTIENIVVTSSSDQFAGIFEFTNHFGKIQLIIENLIENGEIKKDDLVKAMDVHERNKLKRYLKLLEGLQLVRTVEDGYKSGNYLVGLLSEEMSPRDRWVAILSYVIRKRYLTLKKVFGITILDKTISIDNIIYSPELKMKEAVYQRKSTIAQKYKYRHKKNINPLHLTRCLKRLERVDAIIKKGNNYFGVDDLRETMIQRVEREPPLSIHPL